PRQPNLAALLRGRGGSDHEQTLPEAGGSAAGALARGGDDPAVRITRAGETRDLRAFRQLQLSGQRPVRLRRRLRVLLRQAVVDTVFDELRQHGAGRFGVEDLFQGRILVHVTVDPRVQTIVNEALETGLALYERRHPQAKGLIQGSVVVLRNADAAILAEAG